MTGPDPSPASQDTPPALIRAAQQFASHEFWEAHETLEAVWLHSAEPQKLFLQGIIQAAAACHHLVRGNYKGTMNLLGYALDKLHQCEHVSVFQRWMDLEGFIAMLEACREQVARLGPEGIQAYPADQVPTLPIYAPES